MGADLASIAHRLDTAMVIVTAASGDRRAGCLVGFHGQCSISPPRYAVWISTANHTHPVAASAEVLAVHFLTADDHDLAELFGGETGDDVDKFGLVEWHAGPGGVPLLDACPHRLIGRRVAWHEGIGDHTCAVCEPLDVRIGEFVPLGLTDVEDVDAGHPADESQ